MRFEENRGQHDARARFVARQRGLTLFATESALVLSLVLPSDEELEVPEVPGVTGPDATRRVGPRAEGDAGASRLPHEVEASPLRQVGLRMWLEGGAEQATIEANEPLETRSNYFLGNDPSAWRTDVPNWGALRYRDVRPGVDLVLRGSEDGRVEYDLVVAPGASSELVMRIEGAERLLVTDDGALEVHVAGAVLRQSAPVAYQEVDGRRVAVDARYRVLGRERVGFEVGAYDRDQVLVIDPVLEYSTYLGGTSHDQGYGIAVDGVGAAYVAGVARSTDFPTTTGVVQTTNAGASDVFVAKLNAAGSGLAYATYLGGTGFDDGFGIAVDGAGAAYVTGRTSSANFPITLGAAQTTSGGGQDAFVAKLNPAGSVVVYATYLGGVSTDQAFGIAVDAVGAVYVAGATASTNLPTTVGAAQPALGGGVWDAFVAKLNPTGATFEYTTYLGGTGYEEARCVAVDRAGEAYVSGVTESADFPTTAGAFQGAYAGYRDAFVVKLNTAGSTLVYATYLGGTSGEYGWGIAVDRAYSAYIAGRTVSTDFPATVGAAQSLYGGGDWDAFVAKLNATGSEIVYATYLGGTASDDVFAIAVEGAGVVSVTGQTSSTDFPITAGATQTTNAGGFDAFVGRLNASGSGLYYASYLGGAGGDSARGIAVDAAGRAYVVGQTSSTEFPTTSGALQTTIAGGADAFVAKLDLGQSDGTACTADDECTSGFCTDRVCCASACGGGTDDCQACSVAAGAATDGTCGPTTGNVCDDGRACTTSDICDAGACAGTTSACDGTTSCSEVSGTFMCTACPAGTFSADGTGATACAPCAAGTWSTAGATFCVAWSECGLGGRVASEGTASSDRTCTACEAGSYSTSTNASSCTAWSECAPGERVVSAGTTSSDRTCIACEPSSYSTRVNATTCTAWTTCDPGERVADAGSSTTDRVCDACPAGTYSATVNAASCTTWSSCTAGSYVASEGSSTSDRTCAGCVGGYTTGTNRPACTPWTTCAPGAYVSSAGSETSDRECIACGVGTYSASPNAASCTTWTSCPAGTFVASDGSATSDRTCEACGAGTYASSTNAAACTHWSSCAAGTYVAATGTAIEDRVCSACTTGYTASANQSACSAWTSCAEGEFETVPPTATSDRVCAEASACGATRYEVSPPTETMDRVCAPYTECTATQYQSTAPTATSDRGCSELTVCGETQYESVAATGTSDRTCADVTVCDAMHYESTAPTATSDRVCSALTVCSASEYESTAPTATSDRVCSARTVCGEGEFESMAATATSDRECSACSTCEEGEVEVSACEATADTVCGPIDDGGVPMLDGGVDGGVDDGGVEDASVDAEVEDGGDAPDAGETSGGGGCGCHTSARGSMPSLGFVLGAAWMLTRRRRRLG